VVEAQEVTLRTRVTNTTDQPVVVASLQVGDQVQQQTLATDSRKGDTYDVEWRLTAPNGVDPGFSGGANLVRPVAGPGSATVTAGFGATATAASSPTVRRVIPLFAGDTVRLLLPAQGAHAGFPNGKPGWIEVRSLPELQVRATG
jgi:hypothetical protein